MKVRFLFVSETQRKAGSEETTKEIKAIRAEEDGTKDKEEEEPGGKEPTAESLRCQQMGYGIPQLGKHFHMHDRLLEASRVGQTAAAARLDTQLQSPTNSFTSLCSEQDGL